ncbi:uncharacterized protein LOC126998635 [Eriocheir sinensis]|uniref:uncharacterized protein LOC126998635 n=1 Tax=Eriocheir sinensis TaxID=95602 RepID=UPI0021C94E6A|nr:uncharacterized protein LOC126998635 [Eriocheir sinensis]
MLRFEDTKADTLTLLDDLQQMHRAVMPLLRKISQRTRVLVLCQSRFRPYSEFSFLHQIAITAPNFDWSEAAARLFLDQRVQPSTSFMTTLQRQALHGPPHPTSFSSGPQLQAFHDPQHPSSFLSGHQRHLHNPRHPSSFPSGPQRHIHDSLHSTPFSSGHQRHIYDITTTMHPTPFNSEPQTQAFHDSLRSTPFSSGHQRNIHDPFHPTSSSSEPWWWDSGLPLNLAGHQECEELHRLGLTAHPAFRGPTLACHDPHHAGTVTNNDLVTMVLNLLCNSVLKLDQSYCCS